MLRAALTAPAPPSRTDRPAGRPPGEPPRIMTDVSRVLLIEDDPAVREGLLLSLRHQGYQVDAAATGEGWVMSVSSRSSRRKRGPRVRKAGFPRSRE